MPNALQLKEQRAQVWGAMTEIMERAKTGELSAEDRAAYDKAEGELNQLTTDLERQERHEANVATFAEVDRRSVVIPGQRAGEAGEERDEKPRDEQYRDAFLTYMRSGDQGIAPEERQVLQAVDQELRAQSSTPGSAGGYTIPAGFWDKVTETMKAFGGVLSVANVITTDTGATLPWPGNDDTGNVGEQIGENVAVANQDLAFTTKALGAYIFSSKMVKLPLALLQDTGIDIEGYTARKLGERLGRIHNTKQTTGAGGGATPEGLLTNAVNGKTSAAVAAVTYDELIDLEHSVDPAYRGSGRARFMFNDTTLSALRKLKDSQGHPLWQPSLQAGAPDVFNGRPYTINQDMPNLAASAKAIAFGDFYAGYVVRIVKNSTLVRLAERYAEALQVGVFAWNRMDACPDDTAAYKVLTQAAS
jgi:HK97 family phage major capsid protein